MNAIFLPSVSTRLCDLTMCRTKQGCYHNTIQIQPVYDVWLVLIDAISLGSDFQKPLEHDSAQHC